MADNMEQIGLELVLKNQQSFIKGLEDSEKAYKNFISAIGTGTGGLDKATIAILNLGKAAADLEAKQARASKAQFDAAKASQQVEEATSRAALAEIKRQDAASKAESSAGKQQLAQDKLTQSTNKTQESFAKWAEAANKANEAGVKYSDALDTARQKAAEAAKQTDPVSEALNKVASAGAKAAEKLRDLGGGLIGGAVGGFKTLGGAAGGLVEDLGKITGKAVEVGEKIAGLGLRLAENAGKFAIGIGKDSLSSYNDFEAKLKEVEAVSDSFTKEQGQQLRDLAIQMGKDLPISAKDAVQSFVELAKAGFTTDEIIHKFGNSLAYLSTAGGLSMEKASGILGGALRAFGLDANDATKAADIFAAAANASSIDITDMGETLKYVGPVAHSAGMNLQDVAVATGIMGNNMIKGSMAGTSLRSIITRLIDPPKDAAAALDSMGFSIKDQNGNIKPLQQTITELREKFKGLTDAQQVQAATAIAGKPAMAGLLSLIKASPEDFDKMTNAIYNSEGAAKKMSDTMMSSGKGSLEQLSGSIDTLKIAFAEKFAGSMQSVFGILTDIVNAAIPVGEALGSKIGGAVARTAEIIHGFGQNLGSLPKALQQLTDGLSGRSKDLFLFAGVLNSVFGPGVGDKVAATVKKIGDAFGPLIFAIMRIATVLNPLQLFFTALRGFESGGITGALDALGMRFSQVGDTFNLVLPTILENLSKMGTQILDWIIQQAPVFLNGLLEWAKQFGEWVSLALPPLLERLGTLITTLLNWIGDHAGEILSMLGGWAKQFIEWIVPMIPPILGALGKIAIAIIEWIGQQLPGFIAQLGKWAESFWNWIQPQIPVILQNLGDLANQAWNWITSQVPIIVGKLGDWAKSFVDWVGPQIGPLLGQLGSLIGDVLAWIASQLPDIIAHLVEWGAAFIGWVGTEVLPKLPGVLLDIATGILTFLAETAGKILRTIVTEWIPKFLGWVGEMLPKLPGELAKIATSILGWIADQAIKLPGEMLDLGVKMIQSLIKGIFNVKIPMPHINITWGSVGIPGGPGIPVPNFDIQWYAKGGIFTRPMALAGLGDAGPEAALPLNTSTLVPFFVAALQTALPLVARQMQPAASAASVLSNAYYNSSQNQTTNNFNLTMLPVKSTGAMTQDFRTLAALAGV